MRFIEKGDVDNACRLIELDPEMMENQKTITEFLKFAARHGQYKILQRLPLPQSLSEILELLESAKIDAHRPMIRYLMSCLANHFNYQDLQDPFYQDLCSRVPDRARGSVYFPYLWDQVKAFFFVVKFSPHRNLKHIPIRKTLRYLV